MTLPNSSTTSAPTRLAFIITEVEPGGAERCLVELATRIDRAKYSPLVISLAAEPNTAKQGLVQRLHAAGVPTLFLGFHRGWDFFPAVKRISEILRAEQIEIVQTFLFHANVAGARAALAAQIPHVFTGMRVADPRKWRFFVERFATKQVERFICVSQNVAEAYRWAGFASEKLLVIPNGVDLPKWEALRNTPPTVLGLPDSRRTILFVGRLDKQKGLDRFLYEMPAVFRAAPQYDLILVGDGPQKQLLMRLAARLGLADRIHFRGWQSDAAPLIAATDALLLPSRWEGMPNVVLEAMAAGRPVIATQAEGTVELLGLAALEQTAAVGNWRGLRDRLIEIISSPELAANLGQKNQARAAQFSLQSMVHRYERLYDASCRQK